MVAVSGSRARKHAALLGRRSGARLLHIDVHQLAHHILKADVFFAYEGMMKT
jgi:hypothetical protein